MYHFTLYVIDVYEFLLILAALYIIFDTFQNKIFGFICAFISLLVLVALIFYFWLVFVQLVCLLRLAWLFVQIIKKGRTVLWNMQNSQFWSLCTRSRNCTKGFRMCNLWYDSTLPDLFPLNSGQETVPYFFDSRSIQIILGYLKILLVCYLSNDFL